MSDPRQRPSILIPPDREGEGFHLAQFWEHETALRFRGSESLPLDWKFAYQYNPEKKKIIYNENHLKKLHHAATELNDYDNPYATLMIRGPKDLGPQLQATTVMLRVLGPTDDGTTPPTFHGTAFYVAPTMLQTARHNIQPMENVSAARLQFRTTHNTSDSNSISAGFKATPIRPADDSVNLPQAEGVEDKDPVDCSGLKYQNDFTFLKSNRTVGQVLVPGMPADGYVVAAGFPGAPKEEDAVAAAADIVDELRHQDVDQYIKAVVGRVTKLSRLFHEDVLNISPGAVVQQGLRIATHDCTTLPGFSGGPVILIASPGVFIGHHIAGTNLPAAGQNLFLCSTHPAYVAEYVKHVLPELFEALKTNAGLLTSIQQRHFSAWLKATCGAPDMDLLSCIKSILEDRTDGGRGG
ncbi:uncharacterized protein EV422DRAFT_528632 [Fimicolochytrium jonesii]|uniref:uncharacterized protein n=1 Tax=Fimicolochytrium jonesii TaxID=1396493 RepID=UPI0022FDDB86|nr:uncharacterized protein EV422DRAFT_528632 [Fimicolochytrium jonesii]KAI8820981.1 hypothetical protein EV422DRAFT_528632 [Fimicolochytrium jonesii]